MSDELESSSSPRLGLRVTSTVPSPSTRASDPYVAIGTCPARPWHAGAAVASTCPDGQVRSVARRPVRAEDMLFSVPRRLGQRHWWGCRTANSRLAPAEVATRITASAGTLLNPLGRCEVGVAMPISAPRSTVEVYSETRACRRPWQKWRKPLPTTRAHSAAGRVRFPRSWRLSMSPADPA